ncbi:helix-turn-helix domain-containing protein [Nocardia sp. CDC159]|uniref:Helix-turn-helix domain-containing protein n=1 Tax=Nocardia pulmonis TaxID=2951408 RepID=A0A9X2IYG0_9NOCA|nr:MULTISPECIES: helix-turn-helix transcriptional regulator [Nocardia]MCM6774955.1 helix-turn-helix domain-containing protein [Nocardia pulmonis]MCM6789886.1 helix-turn-helix domain-containing protein [Nocardia sp. CDC159]
MDDLAIGQRIKLQRERAGMSRPVLAGLVGRSGEWLKAIENGRLQPPRLPMLLRIARALELEDLAELTGNEHAVPVVVFAGERHAALTQVQAALTDFRTRPAAREVSVPHLAERLRQAWQVRHSSPDHRTQLGALLPGLIRDAQSAARVPGEHRRAARTVLAGVYQLADFYVAYQPAPELVWMVADRGLHEGYEADDPYVIACSSWAMVQALRDSGRWEEAIALAHDATARLRPYIDRDNTSDDWRGILGALEAEIAYVHARRGKSGDAWRHWQRADEIAVRLGPAYRHVQTSFSMPVMNAHAVTLGVELRHAGEALQAAQSFDADHIASIPRRSRHFIEVARAHAQRDEAAATFALLSIAERTAPETIRYNGFARDMLLALQKRPPSGMKDDVKELSRRVGVAA